ncbi:hypothetical protein ACFQ6N_17380 [Kitasatospora sp. NPDC056446]|uniref:hypothetical protein n=1 Tax=Kitasatospora sp. NPDC056446 TaxID=3345819 RepID=UPI0036984813
MSHRTKVRGAVVGVCAVVLLAGPGLLSAPAQAGDRTAPNAVAETRASKPVAQVTRFFDQYLEAVNGTNPNMNPTEVRNEFLTPQLNARLDAWAEANDADPVFRAQNVPQSRDVRYEGSGAGHATVVVTEHFGGSTIDVWYQVPLSGGRITDLRDAPQ